ncbi:MAG TPA: membrane protein insertion efficiency factor YidD [Cellvibrionaceae bacterium]|nr:membrane protein insertion efficiency factor YidD [Cellvibrionaceae bacterium]HMW46695.1 membrane protein insertion efficiency factor YidD [Cellvibrionaceae bacterium]HMW70186.1 membrane protein insertion efficiency factor YidD [Cellvibrionaceae bacterium]HMY41002.1 membrane protein insertion efficiency factor YidD [Marinagarivorans sp.]HNG59602.1 membrane protein insertion efficiency factor YidD [Cellvibrionaceae bacterium]
METHQQTRHTNSHRVNALIQQALQGVIRLYQVGISPWLGKNCRFYPSCSCYTHEAIAIHGPWRGLWLGICRIAKCHPWHPGGVDLVPVKPAVPKKLRLICRINKITDKKAPHKHSPSTRT